MIMLESYFLLCRIENDAKLVVIQIKDRLNFKGLEVRFQTPGSYDANLNRFLEQIDGDSNQMFRHKPTKPTDVKQIAFVHKDFLYTFDVKQSLVYRYNFTEVKIRTGLQEDFTVQHQTFTFQEFFICNSSYAVYFDSHFWLIYHALVVGVPIVVVIIIGLLILILIQSEMKIAKLERKEMLKLVKIRKSKTFQNKPNVTCAVCSNHNRNK